MCMYVRTYLYYVCKCECVYMCVCVYVCFCKYEIMCELRTLLLQFLEEEAAVKAVLSLNNRWFNG